MSRSASASKAAVIGLDAARPDYVKKFVGEGKLPNIARLMREGVFMEAIPSMPHTMAGWCCIATGARVGTSHIALGLHVPGTPLSNMLRGIATDRVHCRAEFLWEAAARAGRRSILFNYPVGSSEMPGEPFPLKNGINVSPFGVVGPPRRLRWTSPPELEEELVGALGPRRPGDPEWEADMAAYLLTRKEWDLFMMHAHGIDHNSHRHHYYTEPWVPDWTPERAEEAWSMVLKAYQDADRQVGKIRGVLGKDALITIVSDHGNTATHTQVLVNNLLIREGLLKVLPAKEEEGEAPRGPRARGARPQIDWSGTRAFATDQIHIFINTRGRDSEGIVDPAEEYRRLQDRIIRMLYDLRNPETGEPCISIAVRAEDAAGLEYYGPPGMMGDVVYFSRPGYTFDPPVTEDLQVFRKQPGTARHGMHHPTFRDLHAVCIMAGPGVKRGVERDRPIHLTDVAPTVAHIAGLPRPAQADGTVLYDILAT